jgi:hypothetical protein
MLSVLYCTAGAKASHPHEVFCPFAEPQVRHDVHGPKTGSSNAFTPSAKTLALGASLSTIGVNSTTVPQFVIEREVPGAGSLSDVQIREMSLRSLQVLSAMGPQIQWLHSYVTEDKVYCVYLAPDEDSIREHARRAGIPADRVSAVRRLIDPAALG